MMVHGRPVVYAEAGDGPVLLLVHGMAGSFENWRAVMEPLAARAHRDRPRPARATARRRAGAATTRSARSPAGLRDLLLALGHERATLVGHSLGGGIAMQFTYQFPEMVERLVLVSSGGLGPEVSPILRAAALPGADLFIAAHRRPGARGRLRARRAAWPRVGLRPSPDVAEVARGYASLRDAERRAAFLAPARPWSTVGGQRVPPATASTSPRAAGADRLGRPRPDHPGARTAGMRTRRSPAAGWRSSTASATCRSSRRPGASSPSSSASWPRPSRRSSTRGTWRARFRDAAAGA